MTSPTGGGTGAMAFLETALTCPAASIVPQIFEYLNQVALSTCCSRPAVALGVVGQFTLDDVTGSTLRDQIVAALGERAIYTIVIDGFPYRRLIGNSANNLTALQILLSALICGGTT